MAKRLINPVSEKAAGAALAHHARRGGFLDIRYGFSLLMRRNVPVLRKAAALGIGALIVSVMIALELPLESIVAGLLNLLGLGLDVVFDGFEAVAGPILFASLLMPRLYREKLPES